MGLSLVTRESKSAQHFFGELQKVFALKPIDYLIHDHPMELLGRVLKKRQNGQTTMEFPQKCIDKLLRLFEITSRVTTHGVTIPVTSRDDEVKCDSNSHARFRTVVGKCL